MQADVDVLVIGAGACGLAAAITASDEGASVAIVEKLDRPGGNSSLSTGSVPAAGSRFQREAGITDSPETMVRDLMAIAGETDDADLVRRLAEVSAETVEWLVDTVGARLTLVTAYKHIGHSVPRLHAPVSRRGQDLVDDLLAAVARREIPLAVGNAVKELIVEADAVQRAAYIAQVTGAPLYVVHTSSAEALEAALRHRRAGARVLVETCPHYLTHDIGTAGDIAKINPPLRQPADREALWQGLLSGEIDTVGTDHVHRDVSSKAGGIWAAPPGCPGLETLLPVLLSEGHHKRGMSLARIAAISATNPARAMGLGHVKGAIVPGLDADLTFVDLKAEWTLNRADVVSGAGYSIYEGWKFRSRVVHSFVRGRPVLRDGALEQSAVGTGRYARRTLA